MHLNYKTKFRTENSCLNAVSEIVRRGLEKELDSDPECAYDAEIPSYDASANSDAELSKDSPPTPTIAASIQQFLDSLSTEERKSHTADSTVLLCEYTGNSSQAATAFRMFGAENLADFCGKLFKRFKEYKCQPDPACAFKILGEKYGFKGKTAQHTLQYTEYRQSVLEEFVTELNSEAVY